MHLLHLLETFQNPQILWLQVQQQPILAIHERCIHYIYMDTHAHTLLLSITAPELLQIYVYILGYISAINISMTLALHMLPQERLLAQMADD